MKRYRQQTQESFVHWIMLNIKLYSWCPIYRPGNKKMCTIVIYNSIDAQHLLNSLPERTRYFNLNICLLKYVWCTFNISLLEKYILNSWTIKLSCTSDRIRNIKSNPARLPVLKFKATYWDWRSEDLQHYHSQWPQWTQLSIRNAAWRCPLSIQHPAVWTQPIATQQSHQ